MKTKGKREESEHLWLSVTCGLLKGGGVALLVTVAVLFICAFAVSSRWLSQRAMDSAVIAACVLGSLSGGMAAVRRGAGKSLFIGLGVGVILFLLLLTAGFFLFDTASFEHGGVGLLLACCCGGGLAGLLRGKPKKKHRR